MAGRLIERAGARAGRVHLLLEPVTTLGRGDDNTLVLPGGHVSTRHARITAEPDTGAYVLEDLGSKNGTFVNGERLAAPRPLRVGDEIALAPPLGPVFAFDATEATLTVAQGVPPAPDAAPTRSPVGGARGVHVDRRTAEVWAHGERVHVTTKEYLALALLAERPGALVSKEELAARVWPEYGGEMSDEGILQLMSRLRRKLEPEPDRPRHLLTVRGLGFRFVAEGTEA